MEPRWRNRSRDGGVLGRKARDLIGAVGERVGDGEYGHEVEGSEPGGGWHGEGLCGAEYSEVEGVGGWRGGICGGDGECVAFV